MPIYKYILNTDQVVASVTDKIIWFCIYFNLINV